MGRKYFAWLALLCGAFWWLTGWQSVYLVKELSSVMAVGATLTWAGLAWLAKRPTWFEPHVHQQLAQLADRVAYVMCAGSVLFAAVTAEFLSSLALMPAQEETAVLERVECTAAGAGRLSGLRFGQAMDGQRMCLRWHTGEIGAVERLALDEWPSLRGLPMGGQLPVSMRRQDSWLWGQGAWYRVDH